MRDYRRGGSEVAGIDPSPDSGHLLVGVHERRPLLSRRWIELKVHTRRGRGDGVAGVGQRRDRHTKAAGVVVTIRTVTDEPALPLQFREDVDIGAGRYGEGVLSVLVGVG